ncbi:MAG: hypothetical protein RBU45_06790 [Myxococcota bacterium]|jgi:hypothetical protein|nr:hypothetical protein [Myxococcota bacterium]
MREAVGPRPTAGIFRHRRVVGAARHVAVLGAVLGVAPLPAMLAASHNYTWSLLIFLLPSALILYWFLLSPQEELRPVRQAFGLTLGLLVPMGFLLNLFFADEFFLYPNPEAVLGWSIPALDFWAIDREHPIPVEEFAFYLSGFVTILLLYVWGSETFFARYKRPLPPAPPPRLRALLGLAPLPLTLTLLLIGLAWAVKRLDGGGFPGYLAYLLALPFLMTTLLYEVARPLINWRAYAFLLLFLLTDSLLWEVTLALPGGWWSYQPAQMVGLFLAPWHDLPLEAVLVWVLSTLTTVVTFEAARLYFHEPATSRRSPGAPAAAAGEPPAAGRSR